MPETPSTKSMKTRKLVKAFVEGVPKKVKLMALAMFGARTTEVYF